MLSLIRLAMMGLVRPLLAPRFDAAVNRVAITAVCALLTMTFTFGAVGCAVASLWLYVTPAVGPVGAPLVCAAALLAVALLLTLIPRMHRRRRLDRQRPPAPEPASSGEEVILAEVFLFFKQHTSLALAIALIIGTLVGNRHHHAPP